jgi:2-isopropylmalate synthase
MVNVRIFDTTLRDGEQTLGVSLSPEQKLAIAKKLDELGVDAIEAGFPVISEGELKAVKMITSEGLSCEIAGLTRTIKKDIDAAVDAGLNYIHTFIATSDIHLEHKLQMTRDQALEKAIEAVEYGKSRGLQVEFSAEDASRTDREFLKKVFVHCHNDFGLAVANALSGIHAGAACAHVTINGIGERAGNASLEEFAMALKCLPHEQNYETNIKSELIYDTSRFISKTVGIIVQPNKAIVGANAFGHESGIHTHGVLNNPLTYEPISPELVGRKRWLKVGKHAGVHGMNAMLAEYGVTPTEEQAKQILEKVKVLGDQGKQVTDVELLSMASEVLGEKELKRIVQLTGFSVSTGIGTMPYAFVKLNIDGQDHIGTDYGVGPVDAALNAIQKITGKISEIRIKDYGLASISGGSGALCEVTVKVEDPLGNKVSAKSVGEDIVTTSVKAVIDAINRIMLKKMLSEK